MVSKTTAKKATSTKKAKTSKASGGPGKGGSGKARKTSAKKQVQRIACEAVLDISTASELQASLLKVLKAKQTVELMAADVERADAASLQVLTAFFQDAQNQNVSVKWVKPSEALCLSAKLLGLEEILQLKDAA